MAVDFFLKLTNGIEGEAKDSGHTSEIRLLSWSWGAAQNASLGTGGLASGKANCMDLNVMKEYDKASAKLFNAMCQGIHIDTITLTAQKASGGATTTPYLTMILTDCLCTSTQVSASSEIPMESCSFAYAKIEFDYKIQGTDGALTTASSATYDLTVNQAG